MPRTSLDETAARRKSLDDLNPGWEVVRDNRGGRGRLSGVSKVTAMGED